MQPAGEVVLERQVQVLDRLLRDEVRAIVPLKDVVEVFLVEHLRLIAMIGELLQVCKCFWRDVASKHGIVEVTAQSLLDICSKSLKLFLKALCCSSEVAKQADGTPREGVLLLEIGVVEEFVLHSVSACYSPTFLAGSWWTAILLATSPLVRSNIASRPCSVSVFSVSVRFTL